MDEDVVAISEALPGLEHVRVLRLQPGDTVVLTVDRACTPKDAAELAARLRQRFPDNECLVIGGGELSVARPE